MMETETSSIAAILPWPPSVNHYWIGSGKRRFISKAGKQFRANVVEEIRRLRVNGFGRRQVGVEIIAHFPDRRKRDLDNILKALLDALSAARVYEDDSQVVEIIARRGKVIRGGLVNVTVYKA